jgi:hypothetical protein
LQKEEEQEKKRKEEEEKKKVRIGCVLHEHTCIRMFAAARAADSGRVVWTIGSACCQWAIDRSVSEHWHGIAVSDGNVTCSAQNNEYEMEKEKEKKEEEYKEEQKKVSNTSPCPCQCATLLHEC